MGRVVPDEIILVDPEDRAIGTAPKLAAHSLGLRHRAFSILLIDDGGRVLLQRRAAEKYHSAGLWANSCCGHPAPGEDTHDAAVRRAHEELGVAVQLTHAGTFMYRASVGESLIEHEIDHVFVGTALGAIEPDPREVAEVKWIGIDELARELRRDASPYAAWLDGVLSVASGAHSMLRRRR